MLNKANISRIALSAILSAGLCLTSLSFNNTVSFAYSSPEQYDIMPTFSKSYAKKKAVKKAKSKKRSALYNPGTYIDKAGGHNAFVTVSVSVDKNRIRDIKIIHEEEDRSYMKKALSVIDSILLRQSTNVDTISGATFFIKSRH